MDRLKYIGGSDIAAIVGLNEYRTALDVYLEKVGLATSDPPNYYMLRGSFFEEGLLRLFVHYNREWFLDKQQMHLIAPDKPHIGGHPDALARRGRNGELECVIEAKKISFRASHRWGRPGEGIVPDDYYCQALYYAGIARLCGHTSVDKFALVADIDGRGELHVDWFPFDQEAFDMLVAAGDQFWSEYVVPRVAPPVDGSSRFEKYAAAMSRTEGLTVDGSEEFLGSYTRYLEAKAESSKLYKVIQLEKNIMLSLMGDAERVGVPGGHVSFSLQSGKVGYRALAEQLHENLEALAGDDAKRFGDWCNEFRSKPFRTFRTPQDRTRTDDE